VLPRGKDTRREMERESKREREIERERGREIDREICVKESVLPLLALDFWCKSLEVGCIHNNHIHIN